MAYTRYSESGHYIYGGADYVDFDGVAVPDDDVDVFIYTLFGDHGDDDDFWERYNHGKRIIDNYQKGFRVQKLWKYAPDLETHISDIAALADEVWHEYFTPIIGAEQVDYMLAKFQSPEQITADVKKNDYTYFIAEDAKKKTLIGCCGVAHKEDYMLLSKLYVRRDFRGRGIARSLFEEAAAFCRWEYGYHKIRLAVDKNNIVAIAIYQKMGFVTVESVKTDIGGGFFMDDYLMEYCIGAVKRIGAKQPERQN